MPMAVMGITHMGVWVFQLFVPMLMGMPEGLIGSVTLQVLGLMAMLMMGIAAMRIVPVAMGITQRLMAMPVAVLFAQQEQHTGGHQASGHQQLRSQGVPQDEQGEQSADEGRGGEQHCLAGRFEIA
jgi:hypothetical protein